MCCCVFCVFFSTALMFVYFFSFSVAAYPQGFFFFYLPYLRRHLSTVYLCQHWAQAGAWERQACSVLSPTDRGGALVCEAFMCVYVRAKGRVAKSLPPSVLATSAGKAAWRVFPPCRPPHLSSPLPASPDATGDLIAAASAGPSAPLCWGIKGCCHCEQRHTKLGPPPFHPAQWGLCVRCFAESDN